MTLIEQPVAQLERRRRCASLTATLGHTALGMADETVCTPARPMLWPAKRPACVHSRWPSTAAWCAPAQVAAVARAADIGWYGGTMLETPSAAPPSAHVFATLGGTHHGCELFGPQLLVDDIVEQQMPIRRLCAAIADGAGFGRQRCAAAAHRFDRARQGLTPVHVDLGPASAQPRLTPCFDP